MGSPTAAAPTDHAPVPARRLDDGSTVDLVDPTPNRGPIPVRAPRSRVQSFASAARRAQVRTGRFGFNAALHQRARRFARHDLAVPRWNPLRTAHAALDELVMVYFEMFADPMPADVFLRVEQQIDGLNALWDDIGVAADPSSLHATPAAPVIVSDEAGSFGGVAGRELRFVSEWEPHAAAPGRAAWLDASNNHEGVIRVFTHDDGPRPWLVVIHGADMGRSWDARMLRVETMARELGVNIAMPVLPLHGPRGDGSRTRAGFPSDDHVANIHGLSHALWDVRRTIAWVREQDPTAIGVFGFSLGGCMASLLACTETDLDAVVMGCPAADLVDLVRANTRPELRNQPRLSRLYGEASRAARPVTAFALQPTLPPERLALVSAHADRLADPVFQVGRLWHHFGRPELVGVDSGHVSFFMQSGWVDQVNELLAARGVAA
ncbi:MAG: hypothetical protein R8F63_12940 [Acidimicrobiales bacterium]|nr:hypothetical protein [Acidimicrobiales bacterium]